VITFSEHIHANTGLPIIECAAITLGSVAPTIIHANQAEKSLVGEVLTEATITKAAELSMYASSPINDLRASKDYRREMVRICVKRCLNALSTGQERIGFPTNPALLGGGTISFPHTILNEFTHHEAGSMIVTKINGKEYKFTTGHDKTLLRLLREEAGLTGTKEGCAEGECGACTVYLDGNAVVSCLVPAVCAHGSEILTIEGLAKDGILHPVQQAFINEGAVQCGYCAPGFIMAGAKLFEEQPHPSQDEIRQSISGNLCR
jgi:carbon-monoxide dehydrogenase medium subunit